MTQQIEAMKLALEALENSIDTVRHDYENDWRHGVPTRKAQLDSIKEMLDQHEQAITDLRQAITAAEQHKQAQPSQSDIKQSAERVEPVLFGIRGGLAHDIGEQK